MNISSSLRLFTPVLLLISSISSASASFLDPLMSEKSVASTPVAGMLSGKKGEVCIFKKEKKALTLVDVVERALCNNPETKAAWASAKIQAAQLGVSRSSYLPTVEGSVPLVWNTQDQASQAATRSRVFDPSISLSYLLFSFERGPLAEGFRQSVKAANWTHNATLQSVLLRAVTAYYQLFSAQETVAATSQAEKYSQENLKAATVRYEVGVATLADKLQAETAYSQAALNRVRAEGQVHIALGTLADVMGMSVGSEPLNIAAPAVKQPNKAQEKAEERAVASLIDQAKTARPDLLAAEAQVKAARAGLKAAAGNALPSVALSGSYTNYRSDRATDYHNKAVGVTVTVPLFSGFNNYYQIRTAKAQLEEKTATRDSLKNQVALDVWQAYYNLATEREALSASSDLLKSAVESEKVAAGRYKAGVGSILELLNAESTLASARLEHIRAAYTWYIARVALAQAIGNLDMGSINN